MELSFVIMILNLHAYRTWEEETINFINLSFKGTCKMLEHDIIIITRVIISISINLFADFKERLLQSTMLEILECFGYMIRFR